MDLNYIYLGIGVINTIVGVFIIILGLDYARGKNES